MKRFLLLFVLIFTRSLLFAQINVDFSYDKAVGCGPLTVSFRDLSTSPAGIMMQKWKFGDGDSAVGQRPTHIYKTKGRYQVTVTVTDSAGNVASSASQPPRYVAVLPLLNIGDDYLICTQSDPLRKATLRNKAAYPYDTAYSLQKYVWSTGDTSAGINVGAGRYTVNYQACGQTLVDSAAVYASGDTTALQILGTGKWDYDNISLDMGITVPFPRTTLSKIAIDWGDGSQSIFTDNYTLLNAKTFRRWYHKPGVYRITFATSFKEPSQYCDTLQEITGVVRESYAKVNFGNDTTVADGDTLVLDAGVAGDSYWWSTGATTQSIKVITTGYYKLFMMKGGDNGGDSIYVTFKPRDSILVSRIGIDSIRCLQVAFRDSSFTPYPIIRRLWDFGDGTTDTLPNPVHNFAVDGIYSTKLKLVSSNGDSTVSIRTLSLNTVPVVNLGPDTLLNPGDTLLLDAGKPGYSPETVYVWSTGASGATLKVTEPGIYWVQATNCGSTRSDTIHILPVTTGLTAGFSSLITACHSLQFTDTSKIELGHIVKWHWDFGDNTADTLQHAAHVYSAPGNYTVTLTVTDNYGYSDSAQGAVAIDTPLAVDLGPDSTQWSGNAVLGHNIPDRSQYRYLWSTGDTTRTIAVSQNGTYSVKVTDILCDTTAADTIQLGIAAVDTLVAGIRVDSIHCGLVAFGDSSIAKPAAIKWEWDFGDGTTDTLQNPLHTYLNNGQYNVWLRVTNANGLTDSTSRLISLSFKPVVDLGSDTSLLPGDSLILDATKPVASPWAGYYWSTGETAATIKAPAPGIYHVVVSYCGNTIADTIQLSLLDTIPLTLVPGIGVDSIRCNMVAFRDSSAATPAIIKWEWDFGDGSRDTLPNPLHTYANNGQYTVQLKVTNSNGVSDSTSRLISLSFKPVVDLGSDTSLLPGDSLILDATKPVASPWASYHWSTGETTATIKAPAPGVHHVVVSYCGNTIADTIRLSLDTVPTAKRLKAGIRSPYPTACADFEFEDASTVTAGAITQWNWSFGDGATSTMQNPPHTYAGNGTYQVRLVVTNNFGEKDTAYATCQVDALPTIDLGHDTTIAAGDTLTLGNGYNGTYQWSTGASTPFIKVTTAGDYWVTLSACGIAVSDTISVTLFPVADIGTVTTVNADEDFTFSTQFNHAFNSNNVFTVQLLQENSAGGKVTGEGELTDIAVIPGTSQHLSLTVNIPDTIPCGKDYRIRVISSSPADTAGWSAKFEVVNMPAATVLQRGDSLFAGKALAYQWYLNNSPIAGATVSYYRARANGQYQVALNNGGNCRTSSSPLNVIITAIADVNADGSGVKAFPNPTAGIVYIRFEKMLLKPVFVTVHDTHGNKVYIKQLQDQASQIDLSALPKGVYYLEITGYEKQKVMQIILQ